MFTFRKKHFVIALLLFFIELYIALYMHDPYIRPYGGDFLVVILFYCCLRTFLNRPVLTLAIGVLAFSYLVEITQYFGLIYKLGWENSLLAHLVLGSTFKWLDMVLYTLGIALVLIVEEPYARKPVERELVMKVEAD